MEPTVRFTKPCVADDDECDKVTEPKDPVER